MSVYKSLARNKYNFFNSNYLDRVVSSHHAICSAEGLIYCHFYALFNERYLFHLFLF